MKMELLKHCYLFSAFIICIIVAESLVHSAPSGNVKNVYSYNAKLNNNKGNKTRTTKPQNQTNRPVPQKRQQFPQPQRRGAVPTLVPESVEESDLRQHKGRGIESTFVYKPNGDWKPGSSFDIGSIPSWLTNMLNNLINRNPTTPAPTTTTTKAMMTTQKPVIPTTSTLSQICGTTKFSVNKRTEYIPSPTVKIVGGTESQKNEMPWQVRVMASTGRGTALCGGTLINAKTVLTAAHCVMEPGMTVRVVMGDYSIRNMDDGETTIMVSQIIVHKDYSTALNNNDFAILILQKEVLFNENVRPACLPKEANKDFTGATALISGWGRLAESNTRLPDTLQKASTRITPAASCKQTYARGRITITSAMICANAPGIDTCQGDSGGPLTTLVNGRFTLIGVTSFGIGCGQSFPGVYSRVQSVLDWIRETGGEYGTA